MQNERFYILINLVVVRCDGDVGSVVVVVVMLRCHHYWVERERLVTSNHPENTDGDNSPAVERDQSANNRGRSHEAGPKGPNYRWKHGTRRDPNGESENLKPVTG